MATNGWSQLGTSLGSLFGSGEDAAYQKGQTSAARVAGLIADARIKRDEAMARENLEGALIGNGTDRGQAGMLATVLRGGFDPTKISGYQSDVQAQDIRSRALNAPDWNTRNELLAVFEGKPVQLANVVGQNLINNQYMEGGGGISTTDQGQASIRQANASANASNASAQSSLGRLGIAQQQFDLQRAGQWNPSGKAPAASATTSATPAAAAGAGIGADWNPRQKAAAAGVQRNLLAYAAALTGKTPEQIRAMSPEEIAKDIRTNGGRLQQGALARFSERIPLLGGAGRLGNEIANSDIVSYSQGAGSAWAGFENPSGPISNADRESAVLQMPNYLDPPEVQATKIRNFLELSGYQASPANLAQALNPTPPAAAPSQAPQRAINPNTGQRLVLINGQWVPE